MFPTLWVFGLPKVDPIIQQGFLEKPQLEESGWIGWVILLGSPEILFFSTELGRFGSGRISRVAGDFHLGDQFRSRMEEAGNDDFGYDLFVPNVWNINKIS